MSVDDSKLDVDTQDECRLQPPAGKNVLQYQHDEERNFKQQKKPSSTTSQLSSCSKKIRVKKSTAWAIGIASDTLTVAERALSPLRRAVRAKRR
jgi:hypothetical protein